MQTLNRLQIHLHYFALCPFLIYSSVSSFMVYLISKKIGLNFKIFLRKPMILGLKCNQGYYAIANNSKILHAGQIKIIDPFLLYRSYFFCKEKSNIMKLKVLSLVNRTIHNLFVLPKFCHKDVYYFIFHYFISGEGKVKH